MQIYVLLFLNIDYIDHYQINYLSSQPSLNSSNTFKKLQKHFESDTGSVVSSSLRPHGLYSPWNSPGQNTRVDSLSLLQGIFSTQGSNPGLLHCRWILYQLSHRGSPQNILGHPNLLEPVDKQCISYTVLRMWTFEWDRLNFELCLNQQLAVHSFLLCYTHLFKKISSECLPCVRPWWILCIYLIWLDRNIP